jgi:hypothetical protein
MIIQRLFSRTWTNLKKKKDRKKKAQELKLARQEINTRRDIIQTERTEGIRKSGLGENFEDIYDKGKKVGRKRITAEDVESRYKSQMKDLNHWSSSIRDTTKRAPKPKVEEIEKGVLEKATEKGRDILKNPKTKKWGLIGVGALGGSLAIDGIDAGVKKIKDKKREEEAKEQILGKRKK